MKRLWKLAGGGQVHDDIALDLIRAFVGSALFIRGCLFMADQSSIISLVRMNDVDWLLPLAMIHSITLAHLLGGLMMAVGLLTRLAALVQIPVLVGAVVLTQFAGGLLSQSMELSVLVLVLAVVIFVAGPGQFSLDHYFFDKEEKRPIARADREQTRRAHVEDLIAEKWERVRLEEESVALEAGEAVDVAEPVVVNIPTTVRATSAPVVTEEDMRKFRPLLKYVILLVGAIIAFATGLVSIPVGFTVEEVVSVFGVVTLVMGMFYLVYRTAFK